MTGIKELEDFVRTAEYQIHPSFKDETCTVSLKYIGKTYHPELAGVAPPEISFTINSAATSGPNLSLVLYRLALEKVANTLLTFMERKNG
jgi:hypothetical protein